MGKCKIQLKSAESHRDGGLKGVKTMGKRTFHTLTYQVSQGSGLLRCQNRGKTPPRCSPGHNFTVRDDSLSKPPQHVPEQDLEI